MTGKRWIGVGVGAAVLALVGVAVVVIRDGEPGPAKEANAFLGAWERFDGAAMGRLADQPGPVEPAVTAMKKQLDVTRARIVAGEIDEDGDTARVPFTADLDLDGLGPWSYRGQFDMIRTDGEWRVRWAPGTLHPDLTPTLRFAVTRKWFERAPILGAGGQPLVAGGDVRRIGLEPGKIRDQAAVEAALQEVLGVGPTEVRAALAQDWVEPDLFVPITDVRLEGYPEIRAQLAPVPGVMFREGRSRLAASDNFAHHVVGRVDEVTAERLAQLGPPYVVGDQVGLSGLEATHERRLAGMPSGEVQLREGERVVKVLHRFPGTSPEPVRLTLDPAVQQAAEQALAGVAQPAALVAVDARTGEIKAAVSRPLNEELNRALAGQYPPGSTFKIVTTAALLSGGLRPDQTVDCPAEAVVGGRPFVNFESGALGPVPFSTAFAQSCNTAFVNLSRTTSGVVLAEAAGTFGFGASYELGLPVGGGRVPVPAGETELAAAAIGQGQVLASPLQMASVAGTVSSGTWHAPQLLAGEPLGEARALDPAVTAPLRQLMTAVVREGTGRLAGRPGQDVAGKTGTAEYGPGTPPATHAWFVGFRGSLAFAVLVEGGGVGGRVAAPLAARFLEVAPA